MSAGWVEVLVLAGLLSITAVLAVVLRRERRLRREYRQGWEEGVRHARTADEAVWQTMPGLREWEAEMHRNASERVRAARPPYARRRRRRLRGKRVNRR